MSTYIINSVLRAYHVRPPTGCCGRPKVDQLVESERRNDEHTRMIATTHVIIGVAMVKWGGEQRGGNGKKERVQVGLCLDFVELCVTCSC